jgi:polyphosphate kinase
MKTIDRDISWLHFNSRLLQEANDKTVSISDRIKFLGIYSNNLDEFFRVRIATLDRIIDLNRKKYPEKVLSIKNIKEEILSYVKENQQIFKKSFDNITDELSHNGVFIINETQLDDNQKDYARKLFIKDIYPSLQILMLSKSHKLGNLNDGSIYLSVCLSKNISKESNQFAIVEIQSGLLGRFIVLPSSDNKTYIIRLDDIIRANLDYIFGVFGYTHFEAYTFKLTRDAEIDLLTDVSKSFLDIVSESILQRKSGRPVRFIYDIKYKEKIQLYRGCKIS